MEGMKPIRELQDLLQQGVREGKRELIQEARNEAAPWSLPKVVLSMTGVDLIDVTCEGTPKAGQPTSTVVESIALPLDVSVFVVRHPQFRSEGDHSEAHQPARSGRRNRGAGGGGEVPFRRTDYEGKVPATTAPDSIRLLKPFTFPRYTSEAVKAYNERIRQENAKRMREEEERVKARRAEEEPVYLDIMRNGHSLAAAILRGPGAWDIADVLCRSLASGPQFSDSFLRITSGSESREIPLDLGAKFEEEEEEE